MQVLPTDLPEVKLIVPRLFRDERGFFCELYNERAFSDVVQSGVHFVQDNFSRSEAAGVVRGLHFQTEPKAQGKLVRVASGSLLDVAVDIRHGSPTFGRHVTMLLSAENNRQAWIPPGFAHGFCTLAPATEVIYKVTEFYAPDCDKGLAWDDPALGIDWPVTDDKAILSLKDRQHPKLADLPAYFHFATMQRVAAP